MSCGFVSCGFGEIIMKHFDDVIQQFYGFHIDHILRFLVNYSLLNLFVIKFLVFSVRKYEFAWKSFGLKFSALKIFGYFLWNYQKILFLIKISLINQIVNGQDCLKLLFWWKIAFGSVATSSVQFKLPKYWKNLKNSSFIYPCFTF